MPTRSGCMALVKNLYFGVLKVTALVAINLAVTVAINLAVTALVSARADAPRPEHPVPAQPAGRDEDKLNPLEFTGLYFLGFYFGVVVLAVVAAGVLRRYLRKPGDEPTLETRDLDPYEIAYLAGEEKMAVNAALGSLVQRGSVALKAGERQLVLANPAPADLHALERAICEAILEDTGLPLCDVPDQTGPALGRIRQRLQDLGLVLTDPAGRWACLLPTLVVLSVAIFGTVKIGVGLERGKPVTFLLFACLATVAVALLGFARPPHRSRRGDRFLAELQENHTALRSTAERRAAELAPADLALAVGLFGLGIFPVGPLAELRDALRPAGSGGGCGSACGSCGGGSGCGGGGCGGCGGCGG